MASSEPPCWPGYKTAALPTELHRRGTAGMLAGGGPDVCIPVLTWEAPVAGFMLKLGAAAAGCPAGTGHNRLAAALCAQYVPKFSLHPPALRLAMAVDCAGAAASRAILMPSRLWRQPSRGLRDLGAGRAVRCSRLRIVAVSSCS